MINTTIPNTLLQLINGGESISVEFKESHKALNKDVYDTVCSFSNRNGGHIFLGVKNNSEIIGIEEDCIEKIHDRFSHFKAINSNLFAMLCCVFISTCHAVRSYTTNSGSFLKFVRIF